MDKAAEHVLSGPFTVVLIFLAAPGIGIGIYVMHVLLQRLRGKGDNGNPPRVNFDGTESHMTWAQLYGQVEAINVMTRQVLDRIHSLEDAISALRKENGAHSDAISTLRERVATMEGERRGRE